MTNNTFIGSYSGYYTKLEDSNNTIYGAMNDIEGSHNVVIGYGNRVCAEGAIVIGNYNWIYEDNVTIHGSYHNTFIRYKSDIEANCPYPTNGMFSDAIEDEVVPKSQMLSPRLLKAIEDAKIRQKDELQERIRHAQEEKVKVFRNTIERLQSEIDKKEEECYL